MMVNRRSVMFMPACVAGGGLFVAAALFTVLSMTPGVSTEGSSATMREIIPASQGPIDTAFAMPPAKSFVEIVARPIFASDRRATQEQEITIETMSSELDVRLIGVIVASDAPIAIVAPRGSDSFARVTVGDRYLGWTVAQIEPHRVTFRRDKAVERVELSFDLPPKRPRAAKEQAAAGTKAKKE